MIVSFFNSFLTENNVRRPSLDTPPHVFLDKQINLLKEKIFLQVNIQHSFYNDVQKLYIE